MKASMRGQAGLLPFLLRQGLSRADITHNILCVRFPDAIQTKYVLCASSELPAFSSRREVTRVHRAVTHQEPDELVGLQSCTLGPWERESERVRVSGEEQPSSDYSSWEDHGGICSHSSRRISTCQSTSHGSLMVLRYFNYCVCGLNEVLASACQSCEAGRQAREKWGKN